MGEETGLSYASTNGRMHACGHDGNTTVLLGAARVLSAMRAQLRGNVKFIFQPAEELGAGAAMMSDLALVREAFRAVRSATHLPVTVKVRAYWDKYQSAYEDMLNGTNTRWAPWYVIPADKKWVAHASISEIIVGQIKQLNLKYTTLSKEQLAALEQAKLELQKE